MKFNRKSLDKMVNDGNIRSYKMDQRPESGFSSDRVPQSARNRSKAKDWLAWNLPFWANDHALVLETEYKFAQDRDWRFDWAIPSLKIAIEFEGGVFMSSNSGHKSVKDFAKDGEKYNRATILGWSLIRLNAIDYSTALKQLNELLKRKR